MMIWASKMIAAQLGTSLALESDRLYVAFAYQTVGSARVSALTQTYLSTAGGNDPLIVGDTRLILFLSIDGLCRLP